MKIIISKRTKEIFSKTICVILVIFTVIGLASLTNYFISTFDDDDLVTINPSYEIGALTSYGKYLESDGAIYTKDAFKCDGLYIQPEFDSTVKYEVFFYDDLGNFVSSTGNIEGYYRDSIPDDATYARIVITPIWDNDIDEEDKSINIFQIRKYSKQLTVKVLKDQKSKSEKIEDSLASKDEVELTVRGRGIWNNVANIFGASSDSPWFFYNVIDVSKTDKITFKVPTTLLTDKVVYNNGSYDAFVYYNLTDKTNLFASKLVTNEIYNEIRVDGIYTYFELDVSSVNEIVFAVNEANVGKVQLWLA